MVLELLAPCFVQGESTLVPSCIYIWYTVENANLAPCEPFPMCVGFQLWSSSYSLVLWLPQNN